MRGRRRSFRTTMDHYCKTSWKTKVDPGAAKDQRDWNYGSPSTPAPPPPSVHYSGNALTRSVELLLSDVAGVQEGEAGGQENDGDPER